MRNSLKGVEGGWDVWLLGAGTYAVMKLPKGSRRVVQVYLRREAGRLKHYGNSLKGVEGVNLEDTARSRISSRNSLKGVEGC